MREGFLAAALSVPPTLQQDLIGSAKNYYQNRFPRSAFGRANGTVNNVRRDLWEGPTASYAFPPAPMQMRLVSSSANDAVGGTGLQSVHLHYLDGSGLEQSIAISLNGITPVLTIPTDITRVNGLHADTAGALGVAAGNISLTDSTGTTTYAYISSGYNTARQAIYTIPADKYGYVNHWQASSGSAGSHFCQVDLRATAHQGVLWPGIFLIQDAISTQNGGNGSTFPIPLRMPPLCDVKLSAISDAANAGVTATGIVMGWLEQI